MESKSERTRFVDGAQKCTPNQYIFVHVHIKYTILYINWERKDTRYDTTNHG